MPGPLRLSVLDQSPVSEGSTGAQALRNTVDLAQLADHLGYHRYWVAEHHGSIALAGASPEALVGSIAAVTARLRVGSGGVMLPHYSPRKVAETFSVLSGLFPGRIDLGVGRTAGADDVTTRALQRDRRQAPQDDFPEQLVELLFYLGGRLGREHPFAALAALPGHPEAPEPWLLGSSYESASWAAQAGLPYAFADFINPGGAESAAAYASRFQPQRIASPQVAVAVAAICAQTDAEAQRLASSGRMARALRAQGREVRVPCVEAATTYLKVNGEPADHGPRGPRAIVGDPATVRSRIEETARAYGADEVLVVTITHDHAARRRSYELIADAFALAPGVRAADTVLA
jgi:luciferase family oxidoreductase group 1